MFTCATTRVRKIKGVSGLMKKILIEKEEKSRECKQLNMFVIDMKIYQKISNDGCTFMKRNHVIVTIFIIYLPIHCGWFYSSSGCPSNDRW